MQFEPLDKRIRDAAEHHHPAYDEKAWDKMEKLLDKHLPQEEKNKRRFIFFILLFVVTGLGAWLLISKPWQSGKAIAATETVPLKDNNSATTSTKVPQQYQENNPSIATDDKTEVIVEPDKQLPDIDNGVSVKNTNSKTMSPKEQSSRVNNPSNISGELKDVQSSFSVTGSNVRKKKASNNKVVETEKKSVDRSNVQPTETALTVVEPIVETKPVTTSKNDDNPNAPIANAVIDRATVKEDAMKKDDKLEPAKEVKLETTAKPEEKNESAKKSKPQKNKKNSSFFVSFSTGPDLSFVGSGNSSQVKLLAGAGIGYTYKEKFTLCTGFYSARKIYSAKPSDYKAPAAFYTYYPYLEKIDADCKVYEIPILLSYNFGKSSNWFVTAGISSFLMKEESYNYTYKYIPTGNSYTSRWTIKDENKHYFSVGTLSAGYKRNIGKRVSVMAEPYIKIPFAGVGYGKVKLNSGGVMFTAGIKLF